MAVAGGLASAVPALSTPTLALPLLLHLPTQLAQQVQRPPDRPAPEPVAQLAQRVDRVGQVVLRAIAALLAPTVCSQSPWPWCGGKT